MEGKVLNSNVYEIQKCEICFQPLTQDLVAMKCSHVAHESCLNKWTTRFKYCPICHEAFEDFNFLKINYLLNKKTTDFKDRVQNYVYDKTQDEYTGEIIVRQKV